MTNIAADIDGSNVNVYIRGINLIYADDGDKTYYHFNAHGDVVVLTNSNGSKTKSYSYNAFGVEYNEATLDDNPFRYCGEYYDKETKTIYLRARYYDAEQGRFTQEDPIRDGYNWYAYCGNNPIMFTDPNGLRKDYNGVAPNRKHHQKQSAIIISPVVETNTNSLEETVVDGIQWVAEEIVNPIVEEVQEKVQDIEGTYSAGLCGSASWCHAGVNAQIGVSFDAQGNVAVQGSLGCEVTTGTDASANVGTYKTITNAPDVTKLEDDGYAFGTTVVAPVHGALAVNAGTDVNVIPDAEAGTNYWGITSVRGIGYSSQFGTEGHAAHSTTKTLFKFNIFKLWENIYNEIMSW